MKHSTLNTTFHEQSKNFIKSIKEDNCCREAFDILQAIRHEFWKQERDKNFTTVASSIHFTSNSGDSNKIKIEIV